jgi:hypothetical protein
MSVRIYKSRQYDAAAQVKLLSNGGFWERFHFRARAYRRNLAVAHQQRAILDDAKIRERGTAARTAAAQRQELRCARNEQGIRQGPGIMPDKGESCTERGKTDVPAQLAVLSFPRNPDSAS